MPYYHFSLATLGGVQAWSMTIHIKKCNKVVSSPKPSGLSLVDSRTKRPTASLRALRGGF